MGGQIRRESECSGGPLSAARTAPSELSSPAAWACAHAQHSATLGSSLAGNAGAAICRTGSGELGVLVSVTPSSLRTTTRHSYGRSFALAACEAWLYSHR